MLIEKVFMSCLLKDLRNFSEIFRKDVTYDNQKTRVSPSL